MIRADGSGELVPIITGATARQSRPSPSAPWVAYTSDETGRPEVYLARLDGSGSRTPASSAGGMSPVWSTAGDTLFYYEGATLVTAVLSLGDQAIVQSRGRTYSNSSSPTDTPDAPAQYDVGSNGFVSVGGSTGGNSIVVRTSFLEELRQRMGGN